MGRRHRELEGQAGSTRASDLPGDPRNRRGSAVGTDPSVSYASPLKVDSRGKVGLEKIKDPGAPPSGDDAAALATWVKELYSNLKRGGII